MELLPSAAAQVCELQKFARANEIIILVSILRANRNMQIIKCIHKTRDFVRFNSLLVAWRARAETGPEHLKKR